MSPFEKCLYLWLEVNGYALEFAERVPETPFMRVVSEDVFRSNDLLKEIASFTGFRPERITMTNQTNPIRHFNLERYPIGPEWERYCNHPEVIEMAEGLGYSMDRSDVEQMIRRYQLPPGLLPRVRHHTHYWNLKAWIVESLRRLHLRQ